MASAQVKPSSRRQEDAEAGRRKVELDHRLLFDFLVTWKICWY